MVLNRRFRTLKVGQDSVEPSAHENGTESPFYTLLGKAPLFVISCLSTRTARQESRPTWDTFKPLC
jgi:hypothetical protein